MRRLVLLGAAVGALLGAVNLTGALAADGNPGKSSPPGQEQTPPGQAAKAAADAEKPALPGQQHVPPGQAVRSESESPAPVTSDRHDEGLVQHESAPAKRPVHEKRTPASDSRSDVEEQEHAAKPSKVSQTSGNSAVAHTHVIICHRTGSKSNPYVVINISMSAWLHGHSTHPPLNGHSDKVLKEDAKPGEKMPRSACGAPANVTPTDPTRPTPPKKPGTPAVPKYDTPPGLPTLPPGGSTSPASPQGDPGSHSGGGSAVAAQVAETAEGGELPFTGMPVWVAALSGFWLLGSGLAIRKAFGRPSEEIARSSDQFTW